MKRTVIGAAVLALGVSTVGIASADKPNDTDTTKTSKDSTTFDCGDGDTVVFAGPDTLWPPNHKMVKQVATATDGSSASPTDAAGSGVTLLITPQNVLDAVGGDGNTDVDIDFPEGFSDSGDGSASVPFNVRAERSGKGEGRTYTFDWTATFDGNATGLGGKTCSSSDAQQDPYVVFVPHDQGKGNNNA